MLLPFIYDRVSMTLKIMCHTARWGRGRIIFLLICANNKIDSQEIMWDEQRIQTIFTKF